MQERQFELGKFLLGHRDTHLDIRILRVLDRSSRRILPRLAFDVGLESGRHTVVHEAVKTLVDDAAGSGACNEGIRAGGGRSGTEKVEKMELRGEG